MSHEVTKSRDPICNMKLPMVGTLYVTRDPICNGTLPRPLQNVAPDAVWLSETGIYIIAHM